MSRISAKIITTLVVIAGYSVSFAQGKDDLVSESRRQQVREIIDRGDTLFSKETWQMIDSAAGIFDSARMLAGQYFGQTDTLYVDAQMWLARCYYWKGDIDVCDSLAEEAVNICNERYGPDNPIAVSRSWPLSVVHWSEGFDDKAIPECLHAIQILEKLPEYEDKYQEALGALEMFYYNQHRWDALDTIHEIMLEYNTRIYGANSSQVGNVYSMMGHELFAQGKTDEAEQIALKALEIAKENSSTEQFGSSYIYSLLGRICLRRGDIERAEEFQRRQLRISEQSLGLSHWWLSQSIRELLTVLTATASTPEDWKEIEDLCDRAASMCNKWWFVRLPWLQMIRCVAYATNGEYEKALAAFNETAGTRMEMSNRAFSYASEETKLQLSRLTPTIFSPFISFSELYSTSGATQDAFLMILKGRARVLDAVAAERNYAFCSGDDELVAMANRWAGINSDISNLYVAGGSQAYIERIEDSIFTLMKTQDQLETDMSERCATFRLKKAGEDFSVSDIALALPEGSVLLEYIEFYPYRFSPASYSRNYGKPVYGVYVLDGHANVNFVDLGSARKIDSLVSECRDNLEGAAMAISNGEETMVTSRLAELTGELYDVVFKPIESYLRNADQLFICPDEQLSLIPFEILATSEGHYLIERFKISYLSSGRDLLKFENAGVTVGQEAIVMASPDYENATDSSPYQQMASLQSSSSRILSRGPEDRSECLTDLFASLPATRIEGNRVSKLLRENSNYTVEDYYGSDATEQVLKRLPTSPGVVHLATHGYFCPKASFSGNASLSENPLLYSGLAMAGANRTVAHENTGSDNQAVDDGILTSLEVSGLKLSMTDLVVLSSCNSGSGELTNGSEGVYGLRRAFQLAGARSIVMSLMNVPDEATQELMERFYKNWLAGESKATALRQASLSMLDDRRHEHGVAHPIFWGSFILIGNPN